MSFLRRLGLGTAGHSLHRQLVIWVLLPQLVLWLGGGFATYRLAVRHVNQAADATLLLATHALARQIKPINSGLLIDFPRSAQDILEADPNDRLLYMVSTPPGKLILGNQQIPLPPHITPRPKEPYFYDGEIGTPGASPHPGADAPKRVRIAALFLPFSEADGTEQWMLVQVARNMAGRDTILHMILMDTLLPLSGLILLMTMVFWAGIGAALAPLLRLRREVDGRSPFDLAPLRIEAAPQEVKGLVQALNELLASVRQNMSAQRRFIADAAHQLRTPLAGLQSQTELALTATSDPDLSARLALVHQSATRGTHLINQMLMLARAEPESPHVRDKSLIELASFVQELVAEAVPRALRADIDLGIAHANAGASAPLQVLGNPLLLRESLMNVLENAFEYAGPGSEVTVAIEDGGGQAVITVSDNGPGIPADERTQVFERFVRGTQTGAGCGLGLAIVKEIVSQHGGSVTLDEVQPHGLKVSIHLPLIPLQ